MSVVEEDVKNVAGNKAIDACEEDANHSADTGFEFDFQSEIPSCPRTACSSVI